MTEFGTCFDLIFIAAVSATVNIIGEPFTSACYIGFLFYKSFMRRRVLCSEFMTTAHANEFAVFILFIYMAFISYNFKSFVGNSADFMLNIITDIIGVFFISRINSKPDGNYPGYHYKGQEQ